jgi:aerobic-type carbon monoxide dehydrogenase small subunit (CoxS/CutS family)
MTIFDHFVKRCENRKNSRSLRHVHQHSPSTEPTISVDLPPEVPLLWVLRDAVGLTGTKFGCGVAACGACTVQIDGGRAVVPSGAGRCLGRVTTIEGLGTPDAMLSRCNRHGNAHQVAQCGYCQSGQIMQAAWLLADDALRPQTPISTPRCRAICAAAAPIPHPRRDP